VGTVPLDDLVSADAARRQDHERQRLWGSLHLRTIANFWINAIVIATVGAIILLFILKLVRR
jgi:hypothetical protein